MTEQTIQSNAPKKGILYVIDDINYSGGAHVATANQITALCAAGYPITVFSGTAPNIKARKTFAGAEIIYPERNNLSELYFMGLSAVLKSRKFSWKDKLLRIGMLLVSRLFGNEYLLNRIMPEDMAETLGKYQIICVISECSKFREYVAKIPNSYKIQWIHTDYASWSEFNDYTRRVTANDYKIYSAFNQIVLISESSLCGFIRKFPEFKAKSRIIRNIIVPEIDARELHAYQKSSTVRILSAARLEAEKDIPRMIRIAARLKAAGLDFVWTVIGGGSGFDSYVDMAKKAGVADCFLLRGYEEDAYPFFRDSELFALFSHYEGLPNTIFESLVLGTPVIATRVGGIPEQVDDRVTGILADDREDDIFEKLSFLIANPQELDSLRKNLQNYRYDNAAVIEKVKDVFRLTGS